MSGSNRSRAPGDGEGEPAIHFESSQPGRIVPGSPDSRIGRSAPSDAGGPGVTRNGTAKRLAPSTVWAYVDAFEHAQQHERQLQVRDFFPPADSPLFEEVATEIVRIRLEDGWNRGQRDTLSRILHEVPELLDFEELLSIAAFEDYRQHRLHGVPVDARRYADRFGIDVLRWDDHALGPGFSATFRSRCDDDRRRRIDAREDDPIFPETGEVFGRFEIVSELGRGVYGRVFAARQLDLANRLVALKLTSTPMRECQRLAQLQHANIVPLYSIHQVGELYAICMPLLGTATLGDAWDALTRDLGGRKLDSGSTPSRSVFVEVIEQGRCRIPAASRGVGKKDIGPADDVDPPDTLMRSFERESHVRSVLQIALRLAEGLSHAHRRRILHRDIKPANVLLADDGTPLLLDFNLSHECDPDASTEAFGSSAYGSVGGTLSHMAPEHIDAMCSGCPKQVTVQSDLYALGVLLYQFMTGRLPHRFDHGASMTFARAQELRRTPIVSPRNLNPLISPAEEAIVLKCLAYDRADRYPTAEALARDLRRHLGHEPLILARNASVAERLQKYVRRHRQLVSLSSLAMAAAVLLLIVGAAAFQFHGAIQRHESVAAMQDFMRSVHRAQGRLLFPDGGSHAKGLAFAEQALAHFNVLDDGDWRETSVFRYLAPPAQAQVEQQVLQLVALMEAERRQDHGYAPRGPARPDPNGTGLLACAPDPLFVAIGLHDAGELRRAIDGLDQALSDTPDHFASWLLMGKCHYGLREYRQARHCFAMASYHDAESAISALSRAMCHFWLNQNEDALEQLAIAERLDPTIARIYAKRAFVYERQRRYAASIEELDKALELAPGTARYLMARSRVRRASGDLVGAESDLALVRASQPQDPESWITRGLARLPESAEDALADFREASQWSATQTLARQHMAHVLSERLDRPQEAVDVLSDLLAQQPTFADALATRATLHARLGHETKAIADVSRCLQYDPTAQVYYEVASVYSLLSEQNDGHQRDLYAERAMHYLSLALRPAYGSDLIATDEDLMAIRPSASFRRIVGGVMTINRHTRTEE